MRYGRSRLHLVTSSAALLALLAGLGVLVDAVAWVGALDLTLVRDAHRLAAEPLVGAARAITAAGGTDAIVALTVTACGSLLALRRPLEALAVALAVASTEAAVALVKHLVLRPRPPATDAIVHAAGYSFPSGHAAASLALFGAVALIAGSGRRRAVRVPLGCCVTALLVAIGSTRVYLGAHYPTDVVAGWLLAAALTMTVLAVLRPRAGGASPARSRPAPPAPTPR